MLDGGRKKRNSTEVREKKLQKNPNAQRIKVYPKMMMERLEFHGAVMEISLLFHLSHKVYLFSLYFLILFRGTTSKNLQQRWRITKL